jgi:hypothetical protein
MSNLSRSERLKKKRTELKSKGGGGNITYLKEGSLRVRILPVNEDDDFVMEVTQFYLGPNIKGVFSPSTFGEPCAIMEKYNDLKNSSDDDDKELAKKFTPKKKYLTACIVLDDKGQKVDEEKGITLVQLTSGLYQEIIDLFLDDEEWGDMTDAENGYDIKLTRVGSGMMDTEYSCKPCKNTKLPKKYDKEIDLEEMVKKIIPSYEETKQKINEFLGGSSDSDDDDEEDEKPKKTSKLKSKLKKKRLG